MTEHTGTGFSDLLRKKALGLGFDLCGIAPVHPLNEHIPVIRDWCSAGMNSDMTYLCNNIERRTDPGKILPGAKSVIVTGLNYYTETLQGGGGVPVISRYAYGRNYHDVIKEKLEVLNGYIKTSFPEAESRTFVDSAPVLEKAWAREAGLGWPGKHSVIINEKIGSFFFIGIVLTTLELGYDRPFSEDKCGSCTLCINSCPTGAINENRTINTGKCIAYLTIESRSPVPDEIAVKSGNRIFGCDRCQEVCPWNRSAPPHTVSDFQMDPEIRLLTARDWRNLSAENFRKLFRHTPVGRKKYGTLMTNVMLITNSD